MTEDYLDYDLGKSPKRWVIAMSLAGLSLFSIFGSIFFEPRATIGVVWFWLVLYLKWPKAPREPRHLALFVVIQLLAFLIFAPMFWVVGKWLYGFTNSAMVKGFGILVILPAWYFSSGTLFAWAVRFLPKERHLSKPGR